MVSSVSTRGRLSSEALNEMMNCMAGLSDCKKYNCMLVTYLTCENFGIVSVQNHSFQPFQLPL